MEDYKKKYEEALERAKVWKEKSGMPVDRQGILDDIFPELKESEDERIRKEIIQSIQDNMCVIHKDKCIAWLEKQGGCSIKWNKNTEDNKPQINHSVLMQTTHGIAEGEWQGEQWHQYRWASIVRDTDVLYWIELSSLEKQGEQKHICKLDNSYAHVIFPFKAKVKSSGTIVTICDGQLSSDGKEWIKYQSDLKDGYKVYEPDNLELVCEIEQNHAWSENAKQMFIKALEHIEEQNSKGYNLTDCDKNSWWEDFKACCGYTEMQNPAWSEEDKIWIDRACMLLDEFNHLSTLTLAKIPHNLNDIINHLKSLKERYTWKPSDEQIEALWDSIPENVKEISEREMLLDSLYQDLKKLREE